MKLDTNDVLSYLMGMIRKTFALCLFLCACSNVEEKNPPPIGGTSSSPVMVYEPEELPPPESGCSEYWDCSINCSSPKFGGEEETILVRQECLENKCKKPDHISQELADEWGMDCAEISSCEKEECEEMCEQGQDVCEFLFE